MRRHSDQDRREVLIEVTARGEELLTRLSLLHWQELRANGPALSGALRSLLEQANLAELPEEVLSRSNAERISDA